MPGAAEDEGGRTLIVSNAPKTITGATEIETLYRCQVPLTAGAARLFRLFFWHVNATGSPLKASVWLSLDTDTTAQVTDYAEEVFPATSNFGAAGICLAKVQLFQSFGAPVTFGEIDGSESPLRTFRGMTVSFKVQYCNSQSGQQRTANFRFVRDLGVIGTLQSPRPELTFEAGGRRPRS